MRRLVLLSAATCLLAGGVAPALAKPDVPPVPVGVSGNGNGGICVTVSYQVPQCVDLGQTAAAR